MTLHIALIYPYFRFADDTTLYMSHTDLAVLHNTINNQLVKLNDWFCANRLSLNVKKTKYALFNQSIKIPNLPQNTAIILNCINLIRIGNVWPEETIKVTWCRASKHVDHQLIIPHNEIHVRDITIYSKFEIFINSKVHCSPTTTDMTHLLALFEHILLRTTYIPINTAN